MFWNSPSTQQLLKYLSHPTNEPRHEPSVFLLLEALSNRDLHISNHSNRAHSFCLQSTTLYASGTIEEHLSLLKNFREVLLSRVRLCCHRLPNPKRPQIPNPANMHMPQQEASDCIAALTLMIRLADQKSFLYMLSGNENVSDWNTRHKLLLRVQKATTRV